MVQMTRLPIEFQKNKAREIPASQKEPDVSVASEAVCVCVFVCVCVCVCVCVWMCIYVYVWVCLYTDVAEEADREQARAGGFEVVTVGRPGDRPTLAVFLGHQLPSSKSFGADLAARFGAFIAILTLPRCRFTIGFGLAEFPHPVFINELLEGGTRGQQTFIGALAQHTALMQHHHTVHLTQELPRGEEHK